MALADSIPPNAGPVRIFLRHASFPDLRHRRSIRGARFPRRDRRGADAARFGRIGRARYREAAVHHGWLHRVAHDGAAGPYVDGWHDPQARRPAMEPPAPTRVRVGGRRRRALLVVGEGGRATTANLRVRCWGAAGVQNCMGSVARRRASTRFARTRRVATVVDLKPRKQNKHRANRTHRDPNISLWSPWSLCYL